MRFHWESVAAKAVLVSGKPVRFPPDIRAHQVVLVYEAPLVPGAPLLGWYTYEQAVCECEAKRLSPFLLEGLRAFVHHVDEMMPFDFHEAVGAFGLARVAATLEKQVDYVSAVFDGERLLDTEDLWKLAAAYPDFDVHATVWRLHDLRRHLLALSGSSS